MLLAHLFNRLESRSKPLRTKPCRSRPRSNARPVNKCVVEQLEDRCLLSAALVRDISPGVSSSNPTWLTSAGSSLYFIAYDQQLWKSDGTAASTMLVKDINAGISRPSPMNLTNVNGTLFLAAYDLDGGMGLWKSDGTSAGTVLVKDMSPKNVVSASISNLTDVNGTLFFARSFCTALDYTWGFPSCVKGGNELWKSNGTSAGTKLVKQINSVPNFSGIGSLTNVNGTVYFAATDGNSGYELWKSNGTSAGTVLVKDIYPGSNGSEPNHLTNVNGTLYFTASDGSSGFELWKTNGTAASTVLVRISIPGALTRIPPT